MMERYAKVLIRYNEEDLAKRGEAQKLQQPLDVQQELGWLADSGIEVVSYEEVDKNGEAIED